MKREVIGHLESLLAYCKTMLESGKIWERDCEALNIAIAALRSPTREQVEKVFRSHWRNESRFSDFKWKKYVCAKCGNGFETDDNPEFHETFPMFCPDCGAPMTADAVDIIMQRLEGLKDGTAD